jgi:predicted nucleotidyltransferase
MKNKIQNGIQNLVVATSFFPFNVMYKLYYTLALQIAARVLAGIPGVETIYLRRGLAGGEIVYGLSDIDLLIITSDSTDEIGEHVYSAYDKLSRVFPVFGNKERELMVLTFTEFTRLFRTHNSYTWRFEEGRNSWIVLAGEDQVKRIPAANLTCLLLPAMEELKVWWSFILADIEPDNKTPLYKRKYTWYKIIAEAAKVFLLVGNQEQSLTRQSALESIKNYVPSNFVPLIQQIKQTSRHLSSKECVSFDRMLELFFRLTAKSYEAAASKKSELKSKPVYFFENISRIENYTEEMGRIKNKYPGSVEQLTIIPSIEFDPDILNNSDIDGCYMVILLKEPPGLDLLNQLSALSRTLNPGITFTLYLSFDNQTAFGIGNVKPQYCLKNTVTDPVFFELLKANSISNMQNRVEFNLPVSFEKGLTYRNESIDLVLSKSDIHKMRNIEFCQFFWSAARAKLALKSLNSGPVRIPINSEQISDLLFLEYPLDADWIRCFYEEYIKILRNRENSLHLYFSRAIDLLRRM